MGTTAARSLIPSSMSEAISWRTSGAVQKHLHLRTPAPATARTRLTVTTHEKIRVQIDFAEYATNPTVLMPFD